MAYCIGTLNGELLHTCTHIRYGTSSQQDKLSSGRQTGGNLTGLFKVMHRAMAGVTTLRCSSGLQIPGVLHSWGSTFLNLPLDS